MKSQGLMMVLLLAAWSVDAAAAAGSDAHVEGEPLQGLDWSSRERLGSSNTAVTACNGSEMGPIFKRLEES